jgi:YrbI family 3-deoxy-D-manno-octulosonate 8-phosphate phosphatase
MKKRIAFISLNANNNESSESIAEEKSLLHWNLAALENDDNVAAIYLSSNSAFVKESVTQANYAKVKIQDSPIEQGEVAAKKLTISFNSLEEAENQPKPKKDIRLFATDVDGVLTDAGMYYSENGEELKKFNTHDGMGLVLLQKAGIKTAIITSENTKMVENRAKKLKVDYLYQGKKDGGKLAAILEMCEKEKITLENVAYIGDDVNCFDALSNVGLAACPSNAQPEILNIPNIQKMTKKGGEGCVREFSRMILPT